MGVRRYQDLVAWQLANDLKNKIYRLIDNSPGAQKDFEFTKQIKGSASSGPANIAEAFASYEHRQAARYTRIGRSSLIETHNHLGDGADRKYWGRDIAVEYQELADHAIAASTKLLKYLSTTDAPSSW
jgi:four helix bundle protein